MILTITIILILVILSFLFYASYSIRSGIYIKTLCNNPQKTSVVALTFDDGPDPNQTPKVLDVLKEYNIKACFFCIGSKIEANKDLLKRMKDEGHLIGNHSFTHFFSFPLSFTGSISQDLKACDREIEKITNEKNRFFRPPFGVTNPMIAKAVKELGYITVGWSIRSFDTCRSRTQVVNKIRRRLHAGAVILLHDPLPQSHETLRAILDLLNENHYKVERIDKLFDIDLKTIV